MAGFRDLDECDEPEFRLEEEQARKMIDRAMRLVEKSRSIAERLESLEFMIPQMKPGQLRKTYRHEAKQLRRMADSYGRELDLGAANLILQSEDEGRTTTFESYTQYPSDSGEDYSQAA